MYATIYALEGGDEDQHTRFGEGRQQKIVPNGFWGNIDGIIDAKQIGGG